MEKSSLGRVVFVCPYIIVLLPLFAACANHPPVIFDLSSTFFALRTFPRVSEERSAHDLEYPDIPSIPEEQEEDVLSTPSR